MAISRGLPSKPNVRATHSVDETRLIRVDRVPSMCVIAPRHGLEVLFVINVHLAIGAPIVPSVPRVVNMATVLWPMELVSVVNQHDLAVPIVEHVWVMDFSVKIVWLFLESTICHLLPDLILVVRS